MNFNKENILNYNNLYIDTKQTLKKIYRNRKKKKEINLTINRK